MRQKLSRYFDMRYRWMKDRIKHKMFNLIWAPGKFNLADYFTKHHPPWHHRRMRHKYVQRHNSALSAIAYNSLKNPSYIGVNMRGCVCFVVIQTRQDNQIHANIMANTVVTLITLSPLLVNWLVYQTRQDKQIHADVTTNLFVTLLLLPPMTAMSPMSS